MQHQLQTLAEKMSNTIYRAAKVCSYQSADADKLLNIMAKIYSSSYPSVHLMYDTLLNLIIRMISFNLD